MSGKLENIEKMMKSKLEGTEFSDYVCEELWDYIWMSGFRVEVAALLSLKPGDKVLDVGCGDGWFAIQNALKYPKVNFVGIDLFEADEAKRIAELLGVRNCKFYKVDALKMSFSEKFDHVVLFMALGNICESLNDLKKLFENCWRALKSGGKLLIVEPFEEDFPAEVRDIVKRLYKLYKDLGKSQGEDKETILSRKATLTTLKKTGFRIFNLGSREFDWYVSKDEAKEYFRLDELPLDMPDIIWVHDIPKRVTIILAMKEGTF